MPFIDNRYKRIYDKLIERARERVVLGYTERHHILPKSLGGVNTSDNLVNLTAREHYIAHLCLTRITEGEARSKMFYAVRMFIGDKYGMHSRIYQMIRENVSLAMRGNTRHQGFKHSDETRRKISESMMGKRLRLGAKHTTKSRQKMRESHLGNTGCLGRIISPETRQKISTANKMWWAQHKQNVADTISW